MKVNKNNWAATLDNLGKQLSSHIAEHNREPVEPSVANAAVQLLIGELEKTDVFQPRYLYSPSGIPVQEAELPSKQEAQFGQGFILTNPNGLQATTITGKWCVYRDILHIDALWAKVCATVQEGKLEAAVASTFTQAQYFKGSFLICVYTKDWRNETDVVAAREVLRSLGVTEEIGYKRDLETADNVYDNDREWFYRD